MTIDFMRKIDVALGVFICDLLSVWNKVIRLFLRARIIEQPKKILLMKLSELGAIVLTYPMLQEIRRKYPQAEIFFLTFEKNKEVFQLWGELIPRERVLTIRDASFSALARDSFEVIRQLRQQKFDLVFDLEFFSRFTAVLTYLSGAPKKVGFDKYTFEGLYRGDLLTHKIQYNPLLHVSKAYFSFVHASEASLKNSPEIDLRIEEQALQLPVYETSSEHRSQLLELLKPLGENVTAQKIYLMNPGENNLPLREWPLENFIAVGRAILREEGTCVIIVGVKESFKDAELEKAFAETGRCLNLTGKTNLFQLMELFLLSEHLVSNDCGLVHLSLLTPLHRVVLYGPESPVIFGPLGQNSHVLFSGMPCSPCLSAFNHRASACRDNVCLKSIPPDAVIRLLARQGQ